VVAQFQEENLARGEEWWTVVRRRGGSRKGAKARRRDTGAGFLGDGALIVGALRDSELRGGFHARVLRYGGGVAAGLLWV
jgi:hypothetical protein